MADNAPRKMRLEDFDITGEISKGSFGVVYRAVRKSDGRVFALKQVKMQGMNRADREEAIDEARVLAQLNHPHVTKHYDSWIDKDNTLNIVMELASRGNLSQLVKANKGKGLSEDLIWKFLIQSLLGLNHIHGKRIIHRDIKALNLFLDSKDNIKIGDLGIARALGEGSVFARSLVGTPYYYSPELCEDKPYDAKSDMWALGVVMYECCMGRFPFEAQNEGALIRKIMAGKYPPITGPYTQSLIGIVTALLTMNPKNRPDTAQLLANPVVLSKAKALGVDLNPRPVGSTEDAPVYDRSQQQQLQQQQQQQQWQQQQGQQWPQQQQQWQQQGPAAPSPRQGSYQNYPPYNNQQSPQQQWQQQQGQPSPSPKQASYMNYPPYNMGRDGGGGPAQPSHPFDLPQQQRQQQQGLQRSSSARPAAGGRPAAAHPFDPPPGYQPQRQQQAGPLAHPFAVDPSANHFDRMADELQRLQVEQQPDYNRMAKERAAALAANAQQAQVNQVKDIINAGYEETTSPGPAMRLAPERMPPAGGRVPRNEGAPYAMHFNGAQSQTMAQQQSSAVWTAKYSPPQYGRKRNPDLMVTGPTLRGSQSQGRPGSAHGAYAAAYAADDATTYISSTTYNMR